MISIDFHGSTIRIAAPTPVLEALDDRFANFPMSEKIPADITLSYGMVSELPARKDPHAHWRSFYKPAQGEALYDPAADLCYLNSGQGIIAVCTPSDGTCSISAMAPLEEKLWLLTHPFVTLPLMEMLKRANRFALHAAGVARNGRSLLICGTSGAGKTTLTVALIRAGFDFMGDDLTILALDPHLRALAFPEVIDITEKSASFFPELLPLTQALRPPGWLKHRLSIGDYYSSAIAWETTPAAVLFPLIANTARSKLVPVSPTAALLELAASVLLTDRSSTQAHLQALGKLTQSVPCYQLLTGNDFDEIPQLLESLL